MPKTTLLTLLLLPVLLYSQNETAILSGRVLDPAGSGVPRAILRLVSRSNGSVRTVVSDHEGLYRFDLLPPGDYSLHAEAQGFKAADDSKVHLEVARASLLDINLTIGAVTDSVRVDAEVSPLVATSVAEGAVISQEKVKALPLNGRQFLQLALLSPGVNSGGLAVQQNSLRQGEIAGLSVAGQRTDDSAYLLDGVINTDPDYNALNYVPIVARSASSRSRWPNTALSMGGHRAGKSTSSANKGLTNGTASVGSFCGTACSIPDRST